MSNGKCLPSEISPVPLEVAPAVNISMLTLFDFIASNTSHPQALELEASTLPQARLSDDTTNPESPFPQLVICLQCLKSIEGVEEENLLKLAKYYALLPESSVWKEKRQCNCNTYSCTSFITTIKSAFHKLESTISVKDHRIPACTELDEKIFCSYE